MVRVSFTANLQRHVACPPQDVQAGTLRQVLDRAMPSDGPLRGYVLDDQGALRKHVTVFVGPDAVVDRRGLTDAVPDGAEVWVMQALSGG